MKRGEVWTVSGGKDDVGKPRPAVIIQDNNFTLTTSWQKFSFTSSSTLLSAASAKSLYIQFLLNQTVASGDGFAITGIQLELGSVPTAFSRAGGTLQGELMACQRYYRKSYQQGTAPATNTTGAGLVVATAAATIANGDNYSSVQFSNPMRTAPTVTIYPYTTASNTGRVSNGGGTDLAAGSGTVVLTADSGFFLRNTSGGAVSSSLGVILYHYQADAEL